MGSTYSCVTSLALTQLKRNLAQIEAKMKCAHQTALFFFFFFLFWEEERSSDVILLQEDKMQKIGKTSVNTFIIAYDAEGV